MKSATTFQPQASWWKTERPAGLPPAIDTRFLRALERFGKANADVRKKGAAAGSEFSDALDELGAAGKAVSKACEKLLKGERDREVKRDLNNTIAVMKSPLKTFLDRARAALDKLAEKAGEEEEDGEDDAGDLKDPGRYAAHVTKMFRRLDKGPMHFGLVIAADEADTRITFHRSRQGKALATKLSSETGIGKFTFGLAGRAEVAAAAGLEPIPSTLYLRIEGRNLPGLPKKLRRGLKKAGVKLVKRVVLISADGVEQDADEEMAQSPEDRATAEKAVADMFAARKAAAGTAKRDVLKAKLKRVEAYLKERPDHAKTPGRLAEVAQLLGRLDGDDLETAEADLRNLLDRLAGSETRQAERSHARRAQREDDRRARDGKPKLLRDMDEGINRADMVGRVDLAMERVLQLPSSTLSAQLLKKCGSFYGRLEQARSPEDFEAVANDLDKVRVVIGRLEEDKTAAILPEARRFKALSDRVGAISDPDRRKALLELCGKARLCLEVGTSETLDEARDLLATLDRRVARAERARKPRPPAPVDNGRAAAAALSVGFLSDQLTDGGTVRTNPQGQDLGQRMADMMAHLDHPSIAGQLDAAELNAMKVHVIVRTVAETMIRDAGQSFAMLPTFMTKLVEYHGDALIKAMAVTDGSGPDEAALRQSLPLVAALASGDPVTPWLEKEIATGSRKPSLAESRKMPGWEVVGTVRDMAERADVKPSKMLQMLEMQHQAHIGAFDEKSVAKGKLKSANKSGGVVEWSRFDTGHVMGEMPPDLFAETVELDKGQPVWDAGGLKFTPVVADKLAMLETVVGTWDAATVAGPAPDDPVDSRDFDKKRSRDPDKAAARRAKTRQKRHAAKMAGVFDAIREVGEAAATDDDLREAYRDLMDRDLKARAAAKGVSADALTPDRASERGGRDVVRLPDLDVPDLTAEAQDQYARPITEKQYRFLRGVVRDELDGAAADPGDPAGTPEKARAFVTGYFRDVLGYDGKAADIMFDKCKSFLESVPLTITFNAADMFREDGEPRFSKDYMSTQVRNKSIYDDADIFGAEPGSGGQTRLDDTIMRYRKWTPPKDAEFDDRGEQYARWRMEKDERETGFNRFAPEENANFGAVNVNFPRTDGGVGSGYGNEHMILRDEVRDVCTYCFTTGGRERRDMGMILADILNDKKKMTRYLPLIMNNATGGAKNIDMADLDLEVHVYGPIDMTRDVKGFSVPADTIPVKGEDDPAEAKKQRQSIADRIAAFSEANGLDAPIRWEPMDPAKTEAFGQRTDETLLPSIMLQFAGIKPDGSPHMHDFLAARARLKAQYPEYAGKDLTCESIFDEMKAAYDALVAAESGNPAMAGILTGLQQDLQMQRDTLDKMTAELSDPIPEVAAFYLLANKFLLKTFKQVQAQGDNADGFAREIGALSAARDAILKLVASKKKWRKRIDIGRVDERFRAAVAHAVVINRYTKVTEPPGSEIALRKAMYGF